MYIKIYIIIIIVRACPAAAGQWPLSSATPAIIRVLYFYNIAARKWRRTDFRYLDALSISFRRRPPVQLYSCTHYNSYYIVIYPYVGITLLLLFHSEISPGEDYGAVVPWPAVREVPRRAGEAEEWASSWDTFSLARAERRLRSHVCTTHWIYYIIQVYIITMWYVRDEPPSTAIASVVILSSSWLSIASARRRCPLSFSLAHISLAVAAGQRASIRFRDFGSGRGPRAGRPPPPGALCRRLRPAARRPRSYYIIIIIIIRVYMCYI